MWQSSQSKWAYTAHSRQIHDTYTTDVRSHYVTQISHRKYVQPRQGNKSETLIETHGTLFREQLCLLQMTISLFIDMPLHFEKFNSKSFRKDTTQI